MGHNRSFSASSQGTQDAENLSDEDANADLSIAIVAKASNRQPHSQSFVNSIILDSDNDDKGDAHLCCQPTAINNPAGPSSVFQETEKPEALDVYVHSYKEKLKELDELRKSSKKKNKNKKKKKLGLVNRNQPHDPASNGRKQDSSYKVIEDDGDNNLEMRKLLRGPRYFDEPQLDAACCFRCGNPGHIAQNCTGEARKKACFVCGSVEHSAKDCPKGVCFICRGIGHNSMSCPNKYNRMFKERDKWRACLRCGDFGHEMSTCDKDYDPEDLKAVQCYVCRKKGHLCCVNVTFPANNIQSCFNCGQRGHTGTECTTKLEEVFGKSCYNCNKKGHEARHCSRALKDEMGYNPQTPHMINREVEHEFEGFKSVPSKIGKHTRWDESSFVEKTPPRWNMDENNSDVGSRSWKKKKKSASKHERPNNDTNSERKQKRWKKWRDRIASKTL